MNEDAVAIKPKALTMEEAASIPLVGLTAWQVLIERANLKKGQKVPIHAGSGGVGTFAIQLAKHLGAVVATTTSTANLDWVKAHGADIVIDYRKDDFATILLRPTGSRFRERHGIVLDRETVHAPVELYKNSVASIEAERQQPVPLAHRRRQPRGASAGALRSVSVEERRDRHETERRYERGVVDLTDGSGATVSGTVYDRIQSDQVLRRAKRVLDIRVRTAAGIDVQNGYPAAWRIRCPVLLDQLRIEKEH